MEVVYPDMYTKQKTQEFLMSNKKELLFCTFFANTATNFGEKTCSLSSKPKIFDP